MLDLRYPPQFLNFLDQLSVFQFNFFAAFKIDCLASTDLYAKFLGTMIAPIVFVAFIQLFRLYKNTSIHMDAKKKAKEAKAEIIEAASGISEHQREMWVQTKVKKIEKQAAQHTRRLSADCVGYSFALVFFLYPMLSRTGAPHLPGQFG